LKPIRGAYVRGTLRMSKNAPAIRIGTRGLSRYSDQDVG
jgi:hypothetical protein